MKKDETAIAWLVTKLQVSPASPPWNPSQQDGELRFLRDRHYALHGEILAVTVIAIFSLFLLFMVIIPCLRRVISTNDSSESQDSALQRTCALPILSRRRVELVSSVGSNKQNNDFSDRRDR